MADILSEAALVDYSPQHAPRPAGWTTAPSVPRGWRAFKMAAPRVGSGLDTDTDTDSDSSGGAAARFREAAWDCVAQAAVPVEPRRGEDRRPAGLCSPLPSPPVWAGPRRSFSCPGGAVVRRGHLSAAVPVSEPLGGGLGSALPAAGCCAASCRGRSPFPGRLSATAWPVGSFPFPSELFPRRWAWIVFQARFLML